MLMRCLDSVDSWDLGAGVAHPPPRPMLRPARSAGRMCSCGRLRCRRSFPFHRFGKYQTTASPPFTSLISNSRAGSYLRASVLPRYTKGLTLRTAFGFHGRRPRRQSRATWRLGVPMSGASHSLASRCKRVSFCPYRIISTLT